MALEAGKGISEEENRRKKHGLLAILISFNGEDRLGFAALQTPPPPLDCDALL
jgi:hypothetical protein